MVFRGVELQRLVVLQNWWCSFRYLNERHLNNGGILLYFGGQSTTKFHLDGAVGSCSVVGLVIVVGVI